MMSNKNTFFSWFNLSFVEQSYYKFNYLLRESRKKHNYYRSEKMNILKCGKTSL